MSAALHPVVVGPTWADELAPPALDAALAALVRPGVLDAEVRVWFGMADGGAHHLLDDRHEPRCGTDAPFYAHRVPAWSSEILRRKLCPSCLAADEGLVAAAEQLALVRLTAAAYAARVSDPLESLALARRWGEALDDAPELARGGSYDALLAVLDVPEVRWLIERAAAIRHDGLAALAVAAEAWQSAALLGVAALEVPRYGVPQPALWDGARFGGRSWLASAWAGHQGHTAAVLDGYQPEPREDLSVAELPGAPCCAYEGGSLEEWLREEWRHAAHADAARTMGAWERELARVLESGTSCMVRVHDSPALWHQVLHLAAVWPVTDPWEVPLVAGLFARRSWGARLSGANAAGDVALALIEGGVVGAQGLGAVLETAAAATQDRSEA